MNKEKTTFFPMNVEAYDIVESGPQVQRGLKSHSE